MQRNERFSHGDVVYFVDDGHIRVGVYDCYIPEGGYAYIDLVELADHRYVDGIEIQRFRSEEEWRPLPKGWTYNTELFKLETRVPEWEQKRRKELHWNNRDDVKAGLDEGILVLAKTVFHGNIEAEIDRHLGFRVLKHYPHWTMTYGQPNMEYRRVVDRDLFPFYEGAKLRLEDIMEKRQAELAMTDEEWSWREIEQDLRFVDPAYAEECRDFFKSLPDIWDVETKRSMGTILWRYFEKKTMWTPVESVILAKGEKLS